MKKFFKIKKERMYLLGPITILGIFSGIGFYSGSIILPTILLLEVLYFIGLLFSPKKILTDK